MGVKGLLGFVQTVCPSSCVTVDLKEMAKKYQEDNPGCTPTIVVDAMCCLRYWYKPDSWIHGGQWLEYIAHLKNFIEHFRAAGIKLVFIFDGVVEQKKRPTWVKRRLSDRKEIAKIFQFVKTNRQQPGRTMFFIPSGLSTFSRFALKSLGQEVFCSKREADYEVAAYGLQNKCMGILGEDTDYVIFNTVPYFSINNLKLNQLVTIMFSREILCDTLGLNITDLPLFACLIGNDIMPEGMLQGFQRKCMSSYRPNIQSHNKRADTFFAVANFISNISPSQRSLRTVEQMLPAGSDVTLLYKEMESYVLPEQLSPWLYPKMPQSQAIRDEQEEAMCPDQEILQIAMEQHFRGENSMICNVLCKRETECSNTLEDESDSELPGQALIYLSLRQHIYALLLGTEKDSSGICPTVKEWYVYPGNPLMQPDIIQAVDLDIPGGTPSLRALWLTEGLETQEQRYYVYLACFHVENLMKEFQALDASTAAVCCLLIYLLLQVHSLSLEDLDAFVAQTLCLQGKSVDQLKHLQLSEVDSRAVHLGFLFVRGIITSMGVNSACGFPFRMDDLMPWKVFDGKLFHQKYLQAHKGCSAEELLEGNFSFLTQFRNLKTLICAVCTSKGRTIESKSRGSMFLLEKPGRQDPSFSQPHRSYLNSPYHYQDRSYQRGGSYSHSSGFWPQHSGRGHSRRRFQPTSHFPR
uniref:Constitutive coactivator of peroxisome proliferator-activated receptor gamma n=1 Tax=Geotrypetes seraphini TaxID=260995 RepID=A0A6P8QDU5_GEOSA|nr:constitutive coactivator of peroxisome proliferator-activated receptor gamma [Geotrypetes seraphini]XP_033794679.1 constitutive coactivator of peroxisome proliferator-activated receptor gamma [Geotrypetes seraphini]XP_033794680.1 constitutive coactivator of peroxisome proliferator-activated receptor gamma [Geotrypetes seraphini]XP_033794681.1 constitutive coactivator of peroxisome proliferator-activated receptor gamma [Geotrypetes seraphini]